MYRDAFSKPDSSLPPSPDVDAQEYWGMRADRCRRRAKLRVGKRRLVDVRPPRGPDLQTELASVTPKTRTAHIPHIPSRKLVDACFPSHRLC